MSNNADFAADSIEGVENEMPSVNEHKTSAAKRGLGYLFLFGILVLGLGLAYFWFVKSQKAASDAPPAVEDQVARTTPERMFDSVPPPPPEANQEIPQEVGPAYGPLGPPAGQQQAAGGAEAPPKPQLDRNQSSLMIVEAEGGGPQGQGGAGGVTLEQALAQTMPQPPRDSGGLAERLSGTVTGMSSANMLADRNMTIAKGAMIDCVLKTRLDTTVPGMGSCIVTRNIYSDNGKILLIERGSEVTGEYTAGVQQGQNRIFVLWTRLKTPNGVVIALDSPGTDSLGGAGLGGHVKYHFWRRFGAAMLLSVVDDAAQFAANRNNQGGNTYNFGSTANAASDMADTVLQQTINIPPTLYKNQGDRINIFVARDLYFGDVYELRTR